LELSGLQEQTPATAKAILSLVFSIEKYKIEMCINGSSRGRG
jgi:hypothetical protein